mgnify:CR=1 FL=1
MKAKMTEQKSKLESMNIQDLQDEIDKIETEAKDTAKEKMGFKLKQSLQLASVIITKSKLAGRLASVVSAIFLFVRALVFKEKKIVVMALINIMAKTASRNQ